jgi:hypothetical protein
MAMERLRTLTESECYLRCYGSRGSDDTVRLIPTDPLSPTTTAGIAARGAPALVAERMRVALEAMIDARKPEAA